MKQTRNRKSRPAPGRRLTKGWMRAALGRPQDEAYALIGEWNGALMTNAADLLAEADMLFDGKRYARAVALAHFAMEEMGKVVSLIGLAVELVIGNEPDWTAAEKAWSSHDMKFELFHVIDLLTQASTAKALSANVELLNEFELRLAGRPLREMSLYVDVEDSLAKVPSERFDEQLAKVYLGTAFHTGKILIDILPTAGERLEALAEHLSDPEARQAFDRARSEFAFTFAAARSKARRELIQEMGSWPAPKETPTH